MTSEDKNKMADSLHLSMTTLLKTLADETSVSYSISIVPEGLKEDTDDAYYNYKPRVVTIGPRFKGSREDFRLTEELKTRCMLYLMYRAGDKDKIDSYVKRCIWSIAEGDSALGVMGFQSCYVADFSRMTKEEFLKTLLVDGCFLLELMIMSKGSSLNSELPCHLNNNITEPLNSPALEVLNKEDILSDLILLENQIPIYVLYNISCMLFPYIFIDNFILFHKLTLSMLGYSPVGRSLEEEAPYILDIDRQLVHDYRPEIPIDAHILDIVHSFVNRRRRRQDGDDDDDDGSQFHHQYVSNLKLKRCASRLLAAGVTIKQHAHQQTNNTRVSNCFCNFFRKYCLFYDILLRLCSSSSNNTRQVDIVPPPEEGISGLDFEFNFEKGKLEIGQLNITKTTKVKWRNMIAWEHHKNKSIKTKRTSSRAKFTAAAFIFKGLICCAADVKLLKGKNIIVDHVKNRSDEELEAFLRTMLFGVDDDPNGVVVLHSSYVKMIHDLNNYSQSIFITGMSKLNAFRCPLHWLVKFLNRNYNFVATLLALLSILQTVYALVAYYYPKGK